MEFTIGLDSVYWQNSSTPSLRPAVGTLWWNLENSGLIQLSWVKWKKKNVTKFYILQKHLRNNHVWKDSFLMDGIEFCHYRETAFFTKNK